MATLYIAQKTNTALTLPVFLAGAYAAHHGVQLSTVFQDTNSAGSSDGAAELVTTEGDKLVDTAVLPCILQLVGSSGKRQGRQSEINRLCPLTVTDFRALDTPIQELESHLTLRSYIVGHSLTLADIVIWGALRSNRVIAGIRRTSHNISRWFSYIESAYGWLPEAVAAFQGQAQQSKAAVKPQGVNYNIGLKNTENGIICRFPPEPSGYLHIGHAKAALLNDYFAHEYGDSRGVLICRFDDTNPSKEFQEFQDSILYDLSLLGITPDRISYSSDYFQQMYDACTELIKSGKAYADNTVKDLMQDQRKNGIASACREMSDGKQWCIRAKISVDDANKALRDPVIYRCNHWPHHRTATSWKIYPTYDFCAPYLDSIEGVTQALRTNEYRDRNPQYRWVQNALGIRQVDIWDFSRLNFIRTVLSKRKLTIFVDEGVVWGWDDPRMPTVRGIRRRGCTIPALRDFILRQGPSQNIVNMDWTQFWAVNKKHIDSIAVRYTTISKLNAVTAIIDGVDDTSSFRRPKHNKNPELGTKEVMVSKEVVVSQDDAQSFQGNEVITLMNWGNAIVLSKTSDAQTGRISALNSSST
ncbi:tRNA synthetases class I, catalytic domain-containing protein [Aspergillus stella-maris]|uniref:tRNA synthetases class I, catalytic domain-containing protein n=1 Tax=Aspergillus stella-maris TaxID=1810926 RepID=UPI003CCC9728